MESVSSREMESSRSREMKSSSRVAAASMGKERDAAASN